MSYGKVIPGCIKSFLYRRTYGRLPIVTYEYQNRQFTINTEHYVDWGLFKSGQVVTLLVDPEKPESCVIYQAVRDKIKVKYVKDKNDP